MSVCEQYSSGLAVQIGKMLLAGLRHGHRTACALATAQASMAQHMRLLGRSNPGGKSIQPSGSSPACGYARHSKSTGVATLALLLLIRRHVSGRTKESY